MKIVASKNRSYEHTKAEPPPNNGHAITSLKNELNCLQKYEKTLKHRMQDRLKFMSSKNALRLNTELTKLERQKDAVRDQISRLQHEDS